MNERLTAALADRYRLERELGHSEGARIAYRKGAKRARNAGQRLTLPPS